MGWIFCQRSCLPVPSFTFFSKQHIGIVVGSNVIGFGGILFAAAVNIVDGLDRTSRLILFGGLIDERKLGGC